LHIKAKQIHDAVRKSLIDPGKNKRPGWGMLVESAVFMMGDATDSGASDAARSAGMPTKFPLGGKSGRVDFSLQPGVIDNEYIRCDPTIIWGVCF
jgi:hypothetical protein